MNAETLYRGLAAIFLMVALTLPYVGGSATAYVTIVLILLLSGWNFVVTRRVHLDTGSIMLLGAFVALLLVFAIHNRPGTTDVLYGFNFVLFALYGPFATALNRLAKPGNSTTVGTLALCGAGLAFVVALVQVFVFHYLRAEGWYSNPIPSATVAVLLGFLALVGYRSSVGWRQTLLLLGPVIGIGTVYLAGSRGPLLAVPFLILIALFMAQLSRRAILLIGLLLVVEIGSFAVLLPDNLQRFVAIGEAANEYAAGEDVGADLSFSIRLKIYESSFRAFLDSPLIGHGWAMKVPAAAKYVDGIYPDSHQTHLHSDIFNFAVSAGIVGLLAYLAVLLAPLASLRATPRDSQYEARRYGVAVLVAGYAACGTINLLFGFEYMSTFYIATAATLIGYCRDAPIAAAA
ncbi:MAG TPA: O-antigen ligase family protein [Devosia sp.]|nr:O-antigen ligase family protein [Devosia sp.]